LKNNGHGIIFRALENVETRMDQIENPVYATSYDLNKTFVSININEGPLSYSYTFDSIYLHFGTSDYFGSEHFIDGASFPAEVTTCTVNDKFFVT